VLLYEFFVPETYLWQKGEEEEGKKVKVNKKVLMNCVFWI
jgi:hypothetical protein